MRQFLACLLISCLGLSLPAAGGPVGLCVAALFTETGTPSETCDCCGCCDSGSELPAGDCDSCPKLQELPDAPAPEKIPTVPVAPVGDLDPCGPGFVRPELLLNRSARLADNRIRGPGRIQVESRVS